MVVGHEFAMLSAMWGAMGANSVMGMGCDCVNDMCYIIDVGYLSGTLNGSERRCTYEGRSQYFSYDVVVI